MDVASKLYYLWQADFVSRIIRQKCISMPIDHFHIMQLMIGYTCVGVFISTAVIIVFALVGILSIKPEYLTKLFYALIVQVVGIGVAAFAGLVHLDPTPIQNTLAKAESTKKELVDTNKALTNAEMRTSGDASTSSLIENVKPRIYIQISNDSQRDIADQASTALKEQNFLVPGVENVGTRSPRGAEVRYFAASEQGGANKIVGILKSLNVTASAKLVGAGSGSSGRQEQFEVWFPKV